MAFMLLKTHNSPHRFRQPTQPNDGTFHTLRTRTFHSSHPLLRFSIVHLYCPTAIFLNNHLFFKTKHYGSNYGSKGSLLPFVPYLYKFCHTAKNTYIFITPAKNSPAKLFRVFLSQSHLFHWLSEYRKHGLQIHASPTTAFSPTSQRGLSCP